MNPFSLDEKCAWTGVKKSFESNQRCLKCDGMDRQCPKFMSNIEHKTRTIVAAGLGGTHTEREYSMGDVVELSLCMFFGVLFGGIILMIAGVI